MRAGRLLSIMITLQLRGRVSARELAAQFEVSKRTIYRDVEELSHAGVPVFAEHGANGGFALLAGWQTRLTGMTEREAEALVFAHLPGAAGQLGLGDEAAAARLKFLASLPEASSDAARQVAERFHLDATPWHRAPVPQQAELKDLARAVWGMQQIKIDYVSWKGRSVRVLEPLGIVLKAGEWYFLANGNASFAIYKLAHLAKLEVLPQRFKRPKRFELAAAWKANVEQFERSLRRGRARLKVRSSALSRLERLGSMMSDPLLRATPDAEGNREAEVDIEGIGHAAGLLLGFGAEIEVIAPEELRQELMRRARGVVALYDL